MFRECWQFWGTLVVQQQSLRGTVYVFRVLFSTSLSPEWWAGSMFGSNVPSVSCCESINSQKKEEHLMQIYKCPVGTLYLHVLVAGFRSVKEPNKVLRRHSNVNLRISSGHRTWQKQYRTSQNITGTLVNITGTSQNTTWTSQNVTGTSHSITEHYGNVTEHYRNVTECYRMS